MTRSMLLSATFFIAGCATPQRYVVDLERIDGADQFVWDGRVSVTMSWKGILSGGSTVDTIKLHSLHGRSLLLDTTHGTVDAYISVEVEQLPLGVPAADSPSKNR